MACCEPNIHGTALLLIACCSKDDNMGCTEASAAWELQWQAHCNPSVEQAEHPEPHSTLQEAADRQRRDAPVLVLLSPDLTSPPHRRLPT